MDWYDFIDEYEGNRKSLILYVKKKDCAFICNRNSDIYNLVFKDKYVEFWGPDDCESIMDFCDSDVSIEILEVCDVSNYNHSDQRYLNVRKKYWLEQLQAEEERDIKWSNDLFNRTINNYRQQYRKKYNEFIQFVDRIDNIYDKCYYMAKKLFFKDNNEWFLTMTYNDMWNYDKLTKEMRAVCMIIAPYIYIRRIDEYKLPFDKNHIKRTINQLIKEIHI